MAEPIRVFELMYPGNRLDSTNREWVRTIDALLRTIESEFSQAVVALHLFLTAQPELWERNSFKRREERMRVEFERHKADVLANRDYLESQIHWKREDWKNGIWPRSYELQVIQIYTKIFLFSMDTIFKCIQTLCKENPASGVRDVRDDFKKAFPKLTDIRDTAHHKEDRARGLNRDGKPLKLAPIVNSSVNAPEGGVLILTSLRNNMFGSTVNDGSFAEIEVSEKTVETVQVFIQRIIDAYPWTGPPKHFPL